MFTMSTTGRYWYSGGYNRNAVATVLVAGLISVAAAVLPKAFADMGAFDVTWIASYSWFIGCGLGYGIFVFLERRNPQIPVLDASDEHVSDGTVARAHRAPASRGLSVHIRVINPNTTRAMTDLIGRSARVVAAPGTLVDAVQPTMGPRRSRATTRRRWPSPASSSRSRSGRPRGSTRYVVACFGDPGVDAARELAQRPGDRDRGGRDARRDARRPPVRRRHHAGPHDRPGTRAGGPVRVPGRVRRVRACEVPVLALEDPRARTRLVDECRRAVEQDGADVVVLGCAGMAELCAVIADEIGVPVVDGVAAGTVLAQSLVALGLRPAATGEYAPPPAKPMAGLLAGFEIRADAPVAVA